MVVPWNSRKYPWCPWCPQYPASQAYHGYNHGCRLCCRLCCLACPNSDRRLGLGRRRGLRSRRSHLCCVRAGCQHLKQPSRAVGVFVESLVEMWLQWRVEKRNCCPSCRKNLDVIRVPLCCRSCLVVVPPSCQLTVWIHIFLCCRWVKMTSCVLGVLRLLCWCRCVVCVLLKVCIFFVTFFTFLVDFSFVQFEEAEVGGLCSFNIFSSCWF